MLLNHIEYALMNNPVRAAIQRHVEARRLLRMGGPMRGGRAFEVGCRRGVGTELVLNVFGADSADAFDLDPRMVALARRFDSASFARELRASGLEPLATNELWGSFAWFTARKPTAAETSRCRRLA